MSGPEVAAPEDGVNVEVLHRIPLTARLVWDVGCATGALGASYKRLNPLSRVFGIDIDGAAARIAATRLDEVALGDVETAGAPFQRHGPLDCIVYGDVLEHLRDPAAVLAAHLKLLAPDGLMLICVPNVEHWSFAARLLAGSWAYEPAGLLDATHLRWFTAATMGRLLEDLGLTVVDVTSRIFEAERQQAFVAAITPALTALRVDAADYAARSAPLQLIFRASRSRVPPLHVVGHMLPPEGGVSHVRVVYPLQALASDPGLVVRRVESGGDLPALAEEVPKILVLHRLVISGESGVASLRVLLACGYLLVMEFDDNPDFMTMLQTPELHTFRGVHAVQTTTPALAKVIGRSNPEVAVFPNAVPILPPVHNFTGTLTLFFGGFNRKPDWAPFMPALNAVAALAGERLRFHVVHDEDFFSLLETEHKAFTPTCDHATYLELLGGCEFAFMPLLDTPFNRCKSDLKFLEAAAARVCAVASPTVYGESIQDMLTGVLFREPEELRQRLLRLVLNPDHALRIGETARAWVARHRMLAYQVRERAAWYRALWARREALTAGLHERLPALAEPSK